MCKIKSVQVVPVRASSIDPTESIAQELEGPTDATLGWAIYERQLDGTVTWYADTDTEKKAMFIGRVLAACAHVSIEPQPWRTACKK